MASFVATFKTCPSCLQVHLTKGFRRDASRRDGLAQRCLVCSAAEPRDAYVARMVAAGLNPDGIRRPALQKAPTVAPAKRCTSCKERKVLPLFYDDAKRRDGKESICRSCSSEKAAARADKAPRIAKPPTPEVLAARAARAEKRAAWFAERDRVAAERVEAYRLAREREAAFEAKRPTPEAHAARVAADPRYQTLLATANLAAVLRRRMNPTTP